MSKEDIVAHLVRVASYLNTTYGLDEKQAGKEAKTPFAAREQGVAIGRRDICARVCDDFAITFGISV